MLPRTGHSLEEEKSGWRGSLLFRFLAITSFLLLFFLQQTEGHVFSFYPHISTTELAVDAISLINYTETECCHFHQQVGSKSE